VFFVDFKFPLMYNLTCNHTYTERNERKFPMKKLLLSLVIATLLLFTVSCSGTENREDGESTPPEGENATPPTDGVSYVRENDVRIVVGDGTDRDSVNKIKKLFSGIYGYYPKQTTADSEEYPYEIVIGKAERDISDEAYAILEEIERASDFDAGYVILVKDGRIAVAFEGLPFLGTQITSLATAIDSFVESYSGKSSIEAENGVLLTGTVDVVAYQRALDEQIIKGNWDTLKRQLSSFDNAEEVYRALEHYYTLYGDGLITWFANLYDPTVGGYYYSNSARDNDEFRPDAESTCQALGFISSSGLAINKNGTYAEAIPDVMREEIIRFIKGLQDPGGFFYHPQWTKTATDANIPRRSRDLSWCTGILSTLGSNPTYDTPNGVKGDGLDVNGNPVSNISLTNPLNFGKAEAASKVILAATYATHLESDETFRAYLENLLAANQGGLHFYFIGNQLTSEMSQILERDRQLKEEGKDYSLAKILIEWLNSHQNPENGLWEKTSDYLGVNGLLKISGIYTSAKVEIPYADKAAKSAIEAITSDEPVGAVVDIYNTWFAAKNVFNNMRLYGTEITVDGVTVTAAERVEQMRAQIISDAATYINATYEKLALFKKADDSFSYMQNMTSPYSQMMPVALPVNEGDVNATVICTNGTTSLMLDVLGLPKPPLFAEADRLIYMSIIEKKRAEAKGSTD